jgi:integrase
LRAFLVRAWESTMTSVEPTKFVWIVDKATGKRTKKVHRDTKWKARYLDPAGSARRQTFDRKADAEEFLQRNGSQIQHNDWFDPVLKRTRFDEWADAWWQTTIKLAPSTRRGYERNLRIHILPAFSGRPIVGIDWMEVELFVASLVKKGSSPKTISHCLSIVSLIMKTAIRAKVLKENPADGHSIGKHRKRPSILTMEQVHQLVEHTDERYKPAVWLLVLARLRTSELCGLRSCDVDWAKKSITINEVQMWVTGKLVVKGPKTESGTRTIPIPEWLIDQLAEIIKLRAESTGTIPNRHDRIFESPRGKPLVDHTVWKIINRARLAAGLNHFRPYDLRHSHASLLISLGAHPKAISERMGHSEIGVTMNVYGHLFEGTQHHLTAELDGLVTRSKAE